jgi:hypothetical protein
MHASDRVGTIKLKACSTRSPANPTKGTARSRLRPRWLGWFACCCTGRRCSSALPGVVKALRDLLSRLALSLEGAQAKLRAMSTGLPPSYPSDKELRRLTGMLSNPQAAAVACVQSLSAMPTRVTLPAVVSNSPYFTVRGPAQPPQHRAQPEEKALFKWGGATYKAFTSDGEIAQYDHTELLKVESLSYKIEVQDRGSARRRWSVRPRRGCERSQASAMTLIDPPARADDFAEGDVLLLRERVDLPGQEEGYTYHHLRVDAVRGGGDSRMACCVPVRLRGKGRRLQQLKVYVACGPEDGVTKDRPLKLTRAGLASVARVTIVRLWRDGRDASLICLKEASQRSTLGRDVSRAVTSLADGSVPAAQRQLSGAALEQRDSALEPPVAAGGPMDVCPKPQDAEGGAPTAVQRSPTAEERWSESVGWRRHSRASSKGLLRSSERIRRPTTSC